jgi:tetratricopeptide (TPR) repeat protein
LPHLRHTLQEIPSPNTLKDISNDGLFPLTARTDLCLALLAASELPGKWKDEALRNVRFFSKGADDVFIELSATFRESTRMRVKRNTSGSRTLLGTAIKPLAEDQQRSRPLNAVLGSLKVSEALNFVQDENLDAAISQLKSWEPLDPRNPSTMERVVLVNVQFQLAKVLRYQGRFDEAHHHLKNPRKETMEGCLVCEIRTDVANEMGIVLTEMNRPVDAKRILQSEIDTLDRKGRTDTAASKSLHLSIAETFMRQGQTEAANDYYLRLSKLGPFADLCHSVGLARVAHSRLEWSKAIEYWTSALGILTDHFPRGDSHSGYTSLGILQSMHVALSESGHEEYSHRTLRQIRVIEAACAPNGCKHWIPGLNSYWMDSISGSIVRQSASL